MLISRSAPKTFLANKAKRLKPVPSPRGGFDGLSPPNRAPILPNGNMKHYKSMA